jgi:sterol desaturase/sphingolipid hydroxylase (fatty acid hydroxylase superfamily)
MTGPFNLDTAYFYLFGVIAVFALIIIAMDIKYFLSRKRTNIVTTNVGIDIFLACGKTVFELISTGIVMKLHFLAWQYRVYEIQINSLIGWFAVFVVCDFIYYWSHRLNHIVGWMWATHHVHHTVTELNFFSSVRIGWTTFLSLAWIFPIPLIFLGLHPFYYEIGLTAVVVGQFWLHTEAIRMLPPIIEYIFNTPHHHRLHHSSQKEFRDINYGAMLIIWDRMFGTFMEHSDSTEIVYGVAGYETPKNPFRIVFDGWRIYFKELGLFSSR